MKLNEIKPKAGSTKNRMRVGRGIGSGKGKTSGVGQKGQKSRSGVAIGGYEGGQMPLYMRMPKSGFNNTKFATNLVELSLGHLQAAIDAKKVDAKKAIDEDMLVEAGVVSRKRDGIKLLANGELTTKVELKITKASKGATEAVEKAGGKIELIVREVAPIKKRGEK
ncbi:MAG: 50S ribosomal protein L15 [Micavibrio sp.]|nr:50S ribosomal protein L15 [Micavibrio sp.]|tara:strand:- start:1494 stop:1991 length:498 start_codon:yes stop_codon:yes gene_type:complete